MNRIIAILLLACSTVNAQVWLGGTNEISGVVSPLLYTNFLAGQFRVTVGALDGGSPIDLSADRVSLQVEDTRDGKLVVSNTCIRLDAYTYRGEGSLSASPAPYTLKVQVYPDANPDAFYPIYWASLTITSSPSASATYPVSLSLVPLIPSNGTIGTEAYPWAEFNAQTGRVGKLIAQNLDVSEAITAIDTGRVSKLGDTMFAPLTNEHGYFGNGIGMSNLQWSAIEGAPTIPDLSDAVTNSGATINGQPVTNGSNIVISQSNVGDVQLSTNQYGKLYYTNAAGEITLLGPVMPITGTVYHLSFESTNDLTLFTNLNYGAWSNRVYGSSLKVITPTESSDLARVAALPVTSTVMRFTAKILGHSAQQGNLNRQYGIAIGNGTSNSYQLRLRLTAGTRQLRGYQGALTSPGAAASGGTAQHPADPGTAATFETLNIEQFPVFLGLDFDGANRVRGYIAACLENGMPAQWVQVSSKTNFNSLGWVGLVGSLASGTAYTNAVFGYDDVTYDEGVYLQ